MLATLLFFPLSAAFAQVTVCASGCDFTTIGAALNDPASTGLDVVVDPGTYTEGDLTVVNRALTSSSPFSPASTIIDATGGNTAVISAASNATIQGFTITGGNQIGAPGGGIRVTGGTVTLRNLIIENNATDLTGGGVGSNTGSTNLQVFDSTIQDNTAIRSGGGIAWDNDVAGSITVTDSFVLNNRVFGGLIPVTASGGGIFVGTFSTLKVDNTQINGNSTEASQRNFGGGIFTSGNAAELSNATVSGNTAFAATTSQGGGVYFSTTGTRTLTINGGSVGSNTAGSGGGVFCALAVADSVNFSSGSVSGNSPDEIFGCAALAGGAAGDTPADSKQSGTDGDPVNTFTGDLFNQFVPDINLGGPMPLNFARYYSSALLSANVHSALGGNWRHNFDWSLRRIGDDLDIVDRQGRLIEFTFNGSTWDLTGTDDVAYQLDELSGILTLLDPRDQRRYTFDSSGVLTVIDDGKGNTHALSYDGASRLILADDGLGRSLDFAYDVDGNLETVSDGTRTVTFAHTGTDLISVTDTGGGVTTFAYDPGSLMISTTNPNGSAPFTQTWNGSGQVATQTDSDLDTFSFTYAGSDTTLTGPFGNSRVHTHTATGEFSNRQDQTGLSFAMGYDTTGRRSSIIDRLGDATSYAYHLPSGKLSAITNADLTTTTLSYAARIDAGLTLYDLTGITHADGTTESFAYDGSGNVLSSTDQAGNVSSAMYNGNGRPLTATNRAGGITTYTYNADTTRAASTDPAGNVTTFGYDGLLRLDVATFADGSSISATYDDKDRVLSVTNENGNVTSFTYDGNGNRTATTDPLGSTTTFSYDGNDRLTGIVDPVAGSESLVWDALARPSTFTDPNGNTVTAGYDTLNRLTSVTDARGNTAMLTYDVEGTLSSRTNALGHTTLFTSDSMGRIVQTSSPLGNAFDVGYDAMGRVATTTDALGNATTFGRDARGLLTNILIPEGIGVSYARNALGQITSITDANSNAWPFTYDNQGRPTASSDPLANNTSITYDNRNRASTVVYPATLGSVTLSYDAAGNRTGSTYSDGTAFTFTYDANNRITAADGMTRGYDANGRIVSSNGIAVNRDAGGRITSMTLASGKAVNYTYDANDNVTQVSDWTGGMTTFAYDAADRLTSVTRPNGVTTAFTYDNDSRLTGIAEGTVSSITLARDGNGRISSATRNVPLPQSVAQSSSLIRTYDGASQVNAHAYDEMGRRVSDGERTFAWDLASRLTSVTEGGVAISFAYDALGRRTARTESGTTRNFVWNDALQLDSVSVEAQGGADLRYFVHLPDGRLLYSIEAADDSRRDYHFDEMGNVLFLTDAAATVIASYAYSPYGELLASVGSADNLFTWQGEFGVMREGARLYYVRARYYDGVEARFISRDPVRLKGPREANPYQYARANPMRNIDPTGRQSVAEEQLRRKILRKFEGERRLPQLRNRYFALRRLVNEEGDRQFDLRAQGQRIDEFDQFLRAEAFSDLGDELDRVRDTVNIVDSFLRADREATDLHGFELPDVPSLIERPLQMQELRDLIDIYQQNAEPDRRPFHLERSEPKTPPEPENDNESVIPELGPIVVIA